MQEIIMNGGQEIIGASKEIEKEIILRCAYSNPKYAAARKYSPYKRITEPEYLFLHTKTRRGICVPRCVDISDITSRFPEAIRREEFTECPVKYPDICVSPYMSQRHVAKKVIETCESTNGEALYVMPTSKGKTITTLFILSEMQQRSLILVDTELIFNGWIREINNVFGIPSGKVGRIRGKDWIIGDVITVAMLQTVSRRKARWQEMWNMFGAVAFDEAQISPAQTYSSIMLRCPCKYRLATTATDTRKDGMERVLYFHFGEPCVRQEVESVETRSSLPVHDAVLIDTQFYMQDVSDNIAFVQTLTENEERNDLIVASVVEQIAEGGTCLVVTTRRSHAKLLSESIGKVYDCDLLLGGNQSKDERAHRKATVQKFLDGKGKCLVTTDKVVFKGANIPPLDRLFLTVPYANKEVIIQLAGRIRRKSPGKKRPIMYVFYDKNIGLIRYKIATYYVPAFHHMKVKRWIGKRIA